MRKKVVLLCLIYIKRLVIDMVECEDLNCTVIHKTFNDEPDSLEIGSASKSGKVKIYGNFNKPDEFKVKIKEAIELRVWTNARLEINHVW